MKNQKCQKFFTYQYQLQPSFPHTLARQIHRIPIKKPVFQDVPTDQKKQKMQKILKNTKKY